MLKKILLSLVLIAPVALIAQDKTAFVNTTEVFQKMPELKEIESKIATKNEVVKKNLDAIQAEYQTKQAEFTAQLEKLQAGDETVTESNLQDLQKSLSQIEERYQTFYQQSQAEMEKYQSDLFTPLNEKIRKAIKEVGDAENYTYILDAGVLLYTGEAAVDATPKVKTKVGIIN